MNNEGVSEKSSPISTQGGPKKRKGLGPETKRARDAGYTEPQTKKTSLGVYSARQHT